MHDSHFHINHSCEGEDCERGAESGRPSPAIRVRTCTPPLLEEHGWTPVVALLLGAGLRRAKERHYRALSAETTETAEPTWLPGLLTGYLESLQQEESELWRLKFERCFFLLTNHLDRGEMPFPTSVGEEVALYLGFEEAYRMLGTLDGFARSLLDVAAGDVEDELLVFRDVMLEDVDFLLAWDGTFDSLSVAHEKWEGFLDLHPVNWFRAFHIVPRSV